MLFTKSSQPEIDIDAISRHVEALSAVIREARPPDVYSTALYTPGPRRQIKLAIGLVICLMLSVLIGNPNLYGQPAMFEVVPFEINSLPFLGPILTSLVINLPRISIMIWVQQALFACGLPRWPLRWTRWRNVLAFVLAFVVGTMAMEWAIDVYLEFATLGQGLFKSGLPEQVGGRWREKECFEYHEKTWCKKH